MKSKPSLRSFLALSGSALLLVSQAHAVIYYWDSDGTNPGLGNTGSLTWGSSFNVATITPALSRGVIGGTFSVASASGVSGDTFYFGTANLSLGATASTIGTTGTLTMTNLVIGAGQTNNVTFSAGGTITPAGTTPTIAVNTTSANATIAATLNGTVGTTKAGAGTLILTGANTYTGATIIRDGGTLQVGNGTSGNLNNTTPSALTFNNGGGTFNVAEVAGSSQGMGALTFSAGHGSVLSTAAAASPTTTTLTFASLATRATGATGNFSLATNTTASENKIVLTITTNAPLDNSGSNNPGLFFGGSEYARYDTTNGYLRAVNYSTDTNAPATVSGTTIGIDDATQDIKLSGAITAQTTASANTLNLASNSLTLQDTSQILSVNGILSTGGAISTAGTIQPASSGGEMVFNVASGTLAVDPIIQNNTSASPLTKSGAGALTLSAANTYTGTTRINAGNLTISGGSAIEDTAAVVLANSVGTTFQLNNNETIGNLSGGGFAGGNVNVQGNTLTLGDATNQTFGGTFTGTSGGGIIKQGAGILTLGNKNSFAGTLTISLGQVDFAYGNDGTSSALALSSGGTISMAGGTTLGFKPATNLPSGLLSAQLPSPNGWTISNAIVVSSGTTTIKFSENGPKWNFTGGVTGGTSGAQTLAIQQGYTAGSGEGQDILFSGVIKDGSGGSTLGVSVDFTASSTVGQIGFVNLSGLHAFTGPISVANTRGLTKGAYLVIGGERVSNHATLGMITGSGSLGTTSPGSGNYTNTISLASGTLLNYASSANQTLGGVISGTGQILKEGAGTLTLTGNNTYSGNTIHADITTATTIRAGAISVGSLNSVTSPTPSASSNLGAPTTEANGTIAIGATTITAQLTYTGAAGETTDRVINLAGASGGATIDQSGASGLLKFTKNFTATGAGIKTLTLQGSTAGTGEISGNIVDNSGTNKTSVTKTGSGTWTLSGSNTYTGATAVNGGTLLINNTTGSGTGGGNVSVTAGTLGGNGSITGTVTIGNSSGSADAILAPGNSIDSIDTGNLTFNSDGSYAVELNGTSVTSDVTNVTGTVIINAATTLTVNVAGTLSASQQYVIVSNNLADPVTGTFAGLAQDAVVGNFGGTDLKISYTGGDGNDIVLYTAAASGTFYGTWATGSEPFDGDANGDSVDDGLAWFLGASGPGVSALDKLPAVATPTGFLTLDFDRVNPSSPAKLYVEYGNDLVGWTKEEIPAASGTFGGDLEVVVTSGTPDQLLVKIPTTHASGGKLFARLSATEN